MRKIREVLRLRFGQGLSQRAIEQSLRLSAGAVNGYLSRARRAGLGWPLPDDLDDERLEALLYPPPPNVPMEQRPVPDWAAVHRELRRPNMTLALLWEEYRAGAADGFGYSWFCDLYRAWVGRLKPTLRQVHLAGEKLFVDFAGHTMEVFDGATGEIRRAEIFVAVLGASNFTYAEATWSQALPDWIAVHVNVLAFLGGVAAADRLRQSEGRDHRGLLLRADGEPDLRRHGARTTAPRSSPRGPTRRATRRRSRSACRWWSAGSWRGCGIGASSRWPS